MCACLTHTRARVTHTIIENSFTVCVERKREVEKGTVEEPATDRWGERGPGCERARESERRRRVREREREKRGGGRERETRGPTGTRRREEEEKEEVEFWRRWGMSRRVVCSHGSSLGTAVQYAGQGKVTLLYVYVCARARARGCPLLASACIYEAVWSVFSMWLYRSSREREREREYQNKGEESAGDGGRKTKSKNT